jgi:hypothetical protein
VKRLLVVVAVLVVVFAASTMGLSPITVSRAQTAGDHCPPGETPQFLFGFNEYAQQNGAVVGEPVECLHYDGQGNGHQRTTTGLLHWHRATNTITFTPTAAASAPTDEAADIRDVNGRTVGQVTWSTMAGGMIHINARVAGYQPQPQPSGHRVSITSAGVCQGPDFATAGTEVVTLPGGLQMYPDGSGVYDHTTPEWSASPARAAFVIHADATSAARIGFAVVAAPGTAVPVVPPAVMPPPAEVTVAVPVATPTEVAPTLEAPTPTPVPPTPTVPPAEPPPVTPTPQPAPVISRLVILNLNKVDEYTDIQNQGDAVQDLNGWTLVS